MSVYSSLALEILHQAVSSVINFNVGVPSLITQGSLAGLSKSKHSSPFVAFIEDIIGGVVSPGLFPSHILTLSILKSVDAPTFIVHFVEETLVAVPPLT